MHCISSLRGYYQCMNEKPKELKLERQLEEVYNEIVKQVPIIQTTIEVAGANTEALKQIVVLCYQHGYAIGRQSVLSKLVTPWQA